MTSENDEFDKLLGNFPPEFRAILLKKIEEAGGTSKLSREKIAEIWFDTTADWQSHWGAVTEGPIPIGKVDILFLNFKSRIEKLESVKAYAQFVVEIDSLIDETLYDLLDSHYNSHEVTELMGSLFPIDGIKIAKVLVTKEIITNQLKEDIHNFKLIRNKIVHTGSLDALLPHQKSKFSDGQEITPLEILESEDPVEYRKAELQKFNEVKEMSQKIMEEILPIWKVVKSKQNRLNLPNNY